MLDQMGTFLLHQTGRDWWNKCRVCSPPSLLNKLLTVSRTWSTGSDLVLCSFLPLVYGCLAFGLFLQHVEDSFVASGTEGDVYSVIGCAQRGVNLLFIVLFSGPEHFVLELNG